MAEHEITVEEAAAIIGMHPGAVRRAITGGRLKARRLGARLYVIERAEAERYRDNPPIKGRPRARTESPRE